VQAFIPEHGYNHIEKEDASVWFMQGMQQDRSRYTSGLKDKENQIGVAFAANVGTQVVWFQNGAGRRKWPATRLKVDKVLHSLTTHPDPGLFKQVKMYGSGKTRKELIELVEHYEPCGEEGGEGVSILVSNVEQGSIHNKEMKVAERMREFGACASETST